MTKILILGGTREAADLAKNLVDAGHDVTTSLAGRTKEPEAVEGHVRIGGFGGVEGLANFISGNGFEKLIDATHPFAEQISANAKLAANLAEIDLEIHTRKPWQKLTEDRWIEAANLEEARDKLPTNARVLLALGSQYIDLFKSRDDVFFLVRMVDQPEAELLLPNHKLLLGKPSSDWRTEAETLKVHDITHIVSRNSGGKGAYAKIEAARNLSIPVIIVNRPQTT